MPKEPAAHDSTIPTLATVLFFFAVFLTGSVVVCGFAQEMLQPKKLRVVLDNNYPPYVFQAGDGTIQGILIDQWRLFEKKTGIRIDLQPMDWANAISGMKAGQFDVIDTIFKTTERQGWLDYTKPYARLEVPVFFNAQIPGISGAASLQGFAVAAKTGDTAVDILRDNGVINLLLYNRYEEIVRAAQEHKVNVFVIDKPPALYFLHKFGIQELFKQSSPLYVGEFHRAVNKGDSLMLRVIQEGFQQISPAELQEIEQKWLGTAITHPFPARAYPYFILAIGLIVVLIATLFIGNRALRKAVAIRTRALQENRRFLGDLIENSGALIFVKDLDGCYTLVNRQWEKVTGLDRQSVFGRTDEELFPGHVGVQFRRNDLEVIESGNVLEKEEVLEDTTGKRYFLSIKFPLRNEDGTISGTCGMTTEITERKRAEDEQAGLREELAQARKMESIGRLAGGIAHDFNNMLGVILGHTELALMRITAEAPLHKHLTEIDKAARRSAELTRRLLAFARKQVVIPKVLDLNDIVDGMLAMLKRLIGEDIDCVWSPGGNLWAVRMDPSQIDQILANLCANARDAITGVGKVVIGTANKQVNATFCQYHEGCHEGEYVVLSVTDNGCGMDKEILANLFEPFYTTKEVGKGTGLGLATVYGIVKQNGGFITVDSEPGKGSSFTIFLPRHDEPHVVPEKQTVKELGVGTETILVVEDEPAILNMTCEMLKKIGYRVVAADSPTEALRLMGNYTGKIDLLITDVIMPVMNGWQLSEALRPLQPTMKLLFTSGYTAEAIAEHNVFDENIHFLQKPFTMQELSVKVRTAMTEKHTEAPP